MCLLCWLGVGLILYAMKTRNQEAKMRLRQPRPISLMSANEVAKTICQRNGEIFWGSTASGSPWAVTLNIACPAGSRPIGVFHSHPGGKAVLSRQDVIELARAKRTQGIHYGCVAGKDKLECYKL